MVFPTQYFNPVFLEYGEMERVSQMSLTLPVIVLLMIYKYSLNSGCLWWFEGHPDFKHMQRNQLFLSYFKIFVDRFLPIFRDDSPF